MFFRTAAIRARTFHSTPATRKTVKETVADVADTVNKKVGKGLASAIESGQKAAASTKDTLGSTAEQTKSKADETSAKAGQKLNQAKSGATKAKEDLENELRK